MEIPEAGMHSEWDGAAWWKIWLKTGTYYLNVPICEIGSSSYHKFWLGTRVRQLVCSAWIMLGN